MRSEEIYKRMKQVETMKGRASGYSGINRYNEEMVKLVDRHTKAKQLENKTTRDRRFREDVRVKSREILRHAL